MSKFMKSKEGGKAPPPTFIKNVERGSCKDKVLALFARARLEFLPASLRYFLTTLYIIFWSLYRPKLRPCILDRERKEVAFS
jgi:hypothetical protein